MNTDTMLSLRETSHVRCLPRDGGGAWLIIEDSKTANQVSIFLPRGVPTEKMQTIADAFNDAIETAMEDA